MEYYSALKKQRQQQQKTQSELSSHERKDMEEPEMYITKWKKVNIQRLHTVWFQIRNILEKVKL